MFRLLIAVFILALSVSSEAATFWTSGRYTNNARLSANLSVTGATVLTVRIRGQTEAGYDFISINDKRGNRLYRGSGAIDKTISAQGDAIEILFTSDSSITASGVTVEIAGTAAPPTPEVSVRQIPRVMTALGWSKAPMFMEHWFAGSGNNVILTLEDVLAMGGSDPFRQKLDQLLRDIDRRDSTLIDAIKYYLALELGKPISSSGTSFLNTRGTFDHISSELKNAGTQWASQDTEKSKMQWVYERTLEQPWSFDDFSGAIGNVTLRLVARGRVEPLPSNMARVTVTALGVYFRDSYDFVEPQSGLSAYIGFGCWNFVNLSVSAAGFNCTRFDNASFRAWNRSQNLPEEAGSFRVLSDPQKRIVTLITPIDFVTFQHPGMISWFHGEYPEYFGSRSGLPEVCYANFVCQNFESGKVIAINRIDLALYWYDGTRWLHFGRAPS